MSVDAIYDDAANENLVELREEIKERNITLKKLSVDTR